MNHSDSAVLEITEALVRSAAYELCVRCLAWPTDEQLSVLRERVLPALEGAPFGSGALADAVGEVVAECSDVDLAELRAAHQLLFTPIENRDCPSYETAFDDRDIFRQTNTMADVAGFYIAHGLAVGGEERQRPDHIATELEFMAFMAAKEAYALDRLGHEELDECVRTQAQFLTDHLGCWAPSFGLRASALAAHPLLGAAARLVTALVQADLDYFGVQPSRVLDEPTPPPEPDDGSCGPCPTDVGPTAPVHFLGSNLKDTEEQR